MTSRNLRREYRAPVLSLVLLCVVQSVTSVHEFRTGVVMVEKSVLPFKMEMIGPAIDMASDLAEEKYGKYITCTIVTGTIYILCNPL